MEPDRKQSIYANNTTAQAKKMSFLEAASGSGSTGEVVQMSDLQDIKNLPTG